MHPIHDENTDATGGLGRAAQTGDRPENRPDPRPEAGFARYGSGPAMTATARSGWRWARAASFTCGTVTAR